MVKPTADELYSLLRACMPSLNKVEQKVSLQLYHLLAQGEPVSKQQLAESLQLPLLDIIQLLDRWWGVDNDNQERITGYWGLSLKPTAHRVQFADKTLYTWCAWDTLFIPALLNQTADITSSCPVTHQPITLTVSPDGVDMIAPAHAILSFITPDVVKIKENVVRSFCHYIHFFSDKAAGDRWCLDHPGTFLIQINNAFTLGQRINAAQYSHIDAA